MATMPNLNTTDPWTIAQKFIDQAEKAKANDKRFEQQLALRGMQSADREYNAENAPRRMYDRTRAVGQAKLDNDTDREAAGLGKNSNRYRGSAQPGDPKFFQEFMDTLKSRGLNNPIGLAAVAGTGQIESGWHSSRVQSEWSDPSESGQKGTSGLALSWRADRLTNARNYAAKTGDDANKPSARAQSNFFVDEDPQLIKELNEAKDLPSAMKAINNRWKFAGYDKGEGSTSARFNSASNYLKTFGSAPLSAKERQAGNAPVVDTQYKYDPDGKEYKETIMDADAFKKVKNGLPRAQRETTMIPDLASVDRKGAMNVKIYTGRMGTAPVVPAVPVAPVATNSAMPAQVSKANGFDPEQEEDEEM